MPETPYSTVFHQTALAAGLICACLTLHAAAQPLPTATGDTITLPTHAGHQLFIPEGLTASPNGLDLLVHFHGDPTTLHNNAAYAELDVAIVSVNYNGLSSAYSGPFSDAALFGEVLDAALTSLRARPEFADDLEFDALSVSSFSAGFAAVREVLKQPTYFDRIDGLLMADSLYASFQGSGDNTPHDSQMVDFRRFAKAAADGGKTMIVTHSQVQTTTYSNTAETADDLTKTVGVTSTATTQTGLGTLDFYRTAEHGNFRMWGATGADGDAHLEHLRYIGEWLDDLPLDRQARSDDPPPGG